MGENIGKEFFVKILIRYISKLDLKPNELLVIEISVCQILML